MRVLGSCGIAYNIGCWHISDRMDFAHFQAAPATTTGTRRGVSTPEEAVIMRAGLAYIYISALLIYSWSELPSYFYDWTMSGSLREFLLATTEALLGAAGSGECWAHQASFRSI